MRSNSPLTIISIIAIGFFLTSCGSSPETPLLTGVSLTTQPMIADVGGAKVGEVVKGSTVECIGFSPDSSTVKIRFGSEEGWVFRSTIAFNVQTLTCTFRDVGLGDCWHVEFDCGDYGDADTSQLDPAGRAFWESLSIEDANGDGVANPEYVGKTFLLRVGQTRGSACNEGQGGEGDVPLLLEFRLAGN